MAVKGARSVCIHRSEAETLDSCRSEGYAAVSAAGCGCNHEKHTPPRKLRRFCTIPFATDPVPSATLSGVECHRQPGATHRAFLPELPRRALSLTTGRQARRRPLVVWQQLTG
jgi:hypothetical protein